MKLFRRKEDVPIRQPHITAQNDSFSFRRSRTLTGSASDSVTSVVTHRDRSDLQSPRMKAHALRQKRRHLALILGGCFLVCIGLMWLMSQFVFSTRAVIVGVNAVDTGSYQKTINEYFGSHPFERFRFALRENALIDTVRSHHAELDSVTIELPATPLGASTARLVARQPVVTWQLGGTKYYVDAKGEAFSTNFFAEPTVAVTDKTGVKPDEQGSIASTRLLKYLGRLIGKIGQGGFKVVSITLPPLTSREIDIQLEGRGYPIKTQLDRDTSAQATDVINAVKYFDTKHITPAYVDVRVSSRAYYQ